MIDNVKYFSSCSMVQPPFRTKFCTSKLNLGILCNVDHSLGSFIVIMTNVFSFHIILHSFSVCTNDYHWVVMSIDVFQGMKIKSVFGFHVSKQKQSILFDLLFILLIKFFLVVNMEAA